MGFVAGNSPCFVLCRASGRLIWPAARECHGAQVDFLCVFRTNSGGNRFTCQTLVDFCFIQLDEISQMCSGKNVFFSAKKHIVASCPIPSVYVIFTYI